MPFYNSQDLKELAIDSDLRFVQNELSDCFLIDNKELSVFILNADNPYPTDASTLKLLNSNKFDIIIHPVFTHPWEFDYLKEHIQTYNIQLPWAQLTWNDKLVGDNYLICNYWATNLSDMIYTWGQEKYTTNNNHYRQYLFSCLNGVAKAHRTTILYHLYCNNYLQNNLVSMSDVYLTSPTSTAQNLSFDLIKEDVKEFLHYGVNDNTFVKFYEMLPITCPQETNTRIPFWEHDAYTNAWINIATEHDFATNFVSEKSIKPFLTEQLAIFVAGPGTVERLRSLGLDVFDDIIDHSYDRELDPVLRFEKIFRLIDQLSKQDWPKIYQYTQERREKNRNFLLSGKLIAELRQNLIKSINTLVHS